jgi:hypothetical protein
VPPVYLAPWYKCLHMYSCVIHTWIHDGWFSIVPLGVKRVFVLLFIHSIVLWDQATRSERRSPYGLPSLSREIFYFGLLPLLANETLAHSLKAVRNRWKGASQVNHFPPRVKNRSLQQSQTSSLVSGNSLGPLDIPAGPIWYESLITLSF